MTAPPLGVGVLGFGVAGRAMAAVVEAHEDAALIAVADPLLGGSTVEVSGRSVALVGGLEDLLSIAGVEAVYVATPTDRHRTHVEACLAGGRAVVVEKPMGASIEDADAMVAAAAATQQVLMVGHSQSYEAPVAAIRQVVTSGEIGALRVVTALNGTDWMYRPRRPADLDVRLGGGVTLRQGSHHFDVVRYIAGGVVRNVVARVGRWDADRGPMPGEPADGAYTALLELVDDGVATVTYNGYDRFPTTELTAGVTETGRIDHAEPGDAHREILGMAPDDERRVQARPKNRRDVQSRPGKLVPTFGFLLVSGTDGDIRITPTGLAVYGRSGVRQVSLAGRPSGRHALVDELVAACRGLRPPVHDGPWGLATLEVCLAVLASSASGRLVPLERQTVLKGDPAPTSR